VQCSVSSSQVIFCLNDGAKFLFQFFGHLLFYLFIIYFFVWILDQLARTSTKLKWNYNTLLVTYTAIIIRLYLEQVVQGRLEHVLSVFCEGILLNNKFC
jgi:Kef-type K+ transport system membrane component KefB